MLATNYFKKEFPEYIETLCTNSNDVLLTGSAVICPAVVPKDIDIMLLVNDINQFLDKYKLEPNGDQSVYVEDFMVSCRYGIYNILLTNNKQYFSKWKFATELATHLELSDKEHRKILFQYICDNDTLTLG